MNKQLFNLYKESERGKRIIEAFNPEAEDVFQSIERIVKYAHDWGSIDNPPDVAGVCDLIWLNFEEKGMWQGDLTRESYSEMIDRFELERPRIDGNNNIFFPADGKDIMIKQNNFREKAAITVQLSIVLYYLNDFFKPYLVREKFGDFQRNCQAIGIDLPPIPHSKDYKTYCLYYFDICDTIDQFQAENELTDAEMCAAIYDFATMLISEEKERAKLPSPTNVWLTGASSGDFKQLDELGQGDNTLNPDLIWACNERTRRGDIVVIYALSPRSSIHSIWRADTQGVFNPFDYYHCRTHVADGVKVPPISFKDLKADTYFRNVPIVRKNLQGINGWELTAKDYSELLRMIEERGGDTSLLPRLFDGSAMDFGTLENEHDVEENILIPMLRKLGYTEADWTRQLSLKAGRKEKAIPDFVFFPSGDRHFENAPMVIEAKYDMGSMTEFNNAYRQALSYARMLRSSLFAVCDKERLVVYRMNPSGTSDINKPLIENHWATIYADDTEGATLKQIIGREVVNKLMNK